MDREHDGAFGVAKPEPGAAKPVADPSLYPHKEVLCHAFFDGQARLLEAIYLATPEQLAAPTPVPMFAEVFPQLGDLMVHLLTSHIGAHIGQLRMWRGAMGAAHVGW